ncbi:Protein ZGRF1, partial [Camelus dromedarius]
LTIGTTRAARGLLRLRTENQDQRTDGFVGGDGVLYTHQKMKKSKVWQDGILKITHLGNKAILYDDKGQCLESIFLKCPEVKPGDDLESDRYLITVEEVKVAGSIDIKQDVSKEAPAVNSKRFLSSGQSLGCQPSGLKRKFTFFETSAEKGKKYNEDKPVDDNDQPWDQEVKLETPSFCESCNLPVTCSNVENDGLLESDVPENNKMPVNHKYQMDIKESILREKAQEINIHGTPERAYKHLQIESSNNSGISDDITDTFSKSNTDNENLSSIHEPVNNVAQPLVEVTFNLNNFETSDTEEESQESNKISQDSEGWVKETLVHDSISRCENVSGNKVDSEHLPLSVPIGGKLSETFPMKEILPSQFCDKTCVGFDMGPWKAGNTGKEIKEECNDTLSYFDSSFEWTDDVCIDHWILSIIARKPLTTVVSQAIPKSPYLNQDPQQMIKENEVEPSESLQSLQFFPLGSEEETAFPALIPKQMERKICDPKPVEFQGHQVKGSATSAVMVRGHSSQLECSQLPESIAYDNYTTDTCFLTPKLPSTCMQIDFLQVKIFLYCISSDEENFPKGGTNFNIEDKFQVIAESNKDSVENDSILDFSPKDSEHSYHYLDYNFKSAESTSWEANKV